MTLVEAGPNILGTFDKALVQYYDAGLKKRGINVLTSTAVTRVEEHGESDVDPHHTTSAHLADGTELPFGMMVWSAGLAPVKFTVGADGLPKGPGGRIEIDEYLRVPGLKGRVFALGDCAGTLPPLASVAEQQGRYISDCFNEHYKHFDPSSAEELPLPGEVAASVGLPFPRRLYPRSASFSYLSVGGMASMGVWGGVVDTTNMAVVPGAVKQVTPRAVSGFAAMLTWKFGYLSKQISWTNMILVPMFWFKSAVFGRDISRF